MSAALVELLKKATIQVRLRSGNELGTGFRISEGLIVTAAHVLGRHDQEDLELLGFDGTRVPTPPIVVRVPIERPPTDRVWPPPDLGLLSVAGRAPIAWQTAAVTDQLPSNNLIALGYVRGLYDRVTLDPVPLTYDGIRRESGTTILKLSGGRIDPGMSGGPVLDLERGLVVGYIKADRGMDGGGFVVSLGSIKEHMPQAWGEAIASASRNATWNATRRLASEAVIDAATVENYLTSMSELFTRGSTLLPAGIDREQIRQPVRLRQVTDEAFGALQTSILVGSSNDGDEPESFIWDPGRSPWPMVGIVASPGMGKSWMLAFHARALAAHGQKTLAAHSNADVKVPVLTEASNYARLLPVNPNRDDAKSALAKATHRTVEGQIPETDCELIIEAALTNCQLVLCVDGLDEVAMDLRPRLATALSFLGPQLDQLVVSARDSARQVLQEVFPRGFSEFRIEGFTIGDARRFVQTWHRGNPAAVEMVGKDLRSFPHLRALARVPLLLGFICRLAGSTEPGTARALPSTRPILYREVALGLLSGRWRDSSARRADAQSSDPLVRLELLSEALGHLASGWRQRPDIFFRSDLQAIIRTLDSYSSVASAAATRWQSWQAAVQAPEASPPDDYVLWEYEYDGLLIPDVVNNRPALRFIHQVFAELCLALDLSHGARERGSAIVEDHRWFDDEWADVFPVSCGIDESPAALLSQLTHPDEDPWLKQCELEARCIAEIGDKSSIDQDQVDRLLTALSVGISGRLHTDALTAARSLECLVDAGLRPAVTVAESLVRDDDSVSKELRFRLILSLARNGSSRGIDGAIAVVKDQNDASTEEMLLAIDALAQSNNQEAVDFLAKRLGLSDEKGRLPLAAALAHGDELSTDTAIEIAKRPDLPMVLRTDVIVALIDSGAGEEAALDLVLDKGVSRVLKCRAMVALLRVGAPVSENDVEDLVRDPNVPNRERIELVRALLLRGDIALLPVGAELITQIDIDFRARFELARTMASISELGLDVVRQVSTQAVLPATSRLQGIRALLEHRDDTGVSEAARLVTSNDDPIWLRVVLFEELLEKSPNVIESLDFDTLLDAFDSDPRNHRRERSIGRLVRCNSRTIRRYGEDRFRETFAEHKTLPPRTLDGATLVNEVSMAGEAGVTLLLSLALDSEYPVDIRVRAAVAAAESDPTQAEALGEFLEDTTVSESVRSRLTVALGMLGCRAAFHRLMALLPASEPAYTALGALLSSPSSTNEMIRLGLKAGGQAQVYLKGEPPPTWDVDFNEEVQELEIAAASDAERNMRIEWATKRLRQRVYSRLLSLLLPAERIGLYQVDKNRDSSETRNWIARWIPEYRQIVAEEVVVLRRELNEDPTQLPSLAESRTELESIRKVAGLLDEWVNASRRSDWNTVASLLHSYKEIIGSDLSQEILHLAQKLGDAWPLHAAHRYLAFRASEDEAEAATLEIQRANVLYDTIREYLDEENGHLALDAAALAVLIYPTSAVGWFYAGAAALLLKQKDLAQRLMRTSAQNASPGQAVDGRKSLTTFASAWSSEREVVEELREILGSVEGALELETSVHGHGDSTDEP